MWTFLSKAFGGQVRTALAAVAGYFVLHGWLSPDESSAFQSDAAAVVLKYAALLFSAGWSLWEKYRASLRELAREQLIAEKTPATDEAIRARMLHLGFANLLKYPHRDLLARMAMLEARVHDLEAK